MYVKQLCWYKMNSYSIGIGFVITPEPDGFRIALKLWNRHAGVYLVYTKPDHPIICSWKPKEQKQCP